MLKSIDRKVDQSLQYLPPLPHKEDTTRELLKKELLDADYQHTSERLLNLISFENISKEELLLVLNEKLKNTSNDSCKLNIIEIFLKVSHLTLQNLQNFSCDLRQAIDKPILKNYMIKKQSFTIQEKEWFIDYCILKQDIESVFQINWSIELISQSLMAVVNNDNIHLFASQKKILGAIISKSINSN